MDGAVQICRGFTVAQWKTLHTRLVNRDGTNSDDQDEWHCAVEVFERRIHERFLSCIEALESTDSKSDISVPDGAAADCSTLPHRNEAVVPGFAIMALCCLLAETFSLFAASRIFHTNQRQGAPTLANRASEFRRPVPLPLSRHISDDQPSGAHSPTSK